MLAEENKKKARRFMEEALGQDKPELLDDLLDPDFVRYDPYIEASPRAGSYYVSARPACGLGPCALCGG